MMDASETEVLNEIFDEVLAIPLPNLDQELVKSGLMDSMAIIALVVEIEDRFGIEIQTADLDLRSLATVRGMAEMIKRTKDIPA